MNGLDLLLIVLVIAGGFYLFVAGAARLEEWEDDISRRHFERMQRISRELDRPEPFDWALDVFDEIDQLPEAVT